MLQILCVILLGLVVFAVMYQVLARYIVHDSTAWTPELASYSFVWLTMLAIALGVRRGRHMVLDIWEYVPNRRWIAIAIDTFVALAVIVVLALLAWFGFQTLGPALRRTMPGMGISYVWVALAVPVGSLLSLVFAIEAWWLLRRAPVGVDPLPSGVIWQPEGSVILKGEI